MHHLHTLTFLQAAVIGLVQGISELFPVSSLAHTVLIPSLIGGSWAKLVSQESSAESPYLAFIVGLHLATSLALLGYYWRTWVRLISGFFRSLARRRVESTDERLAWLIVIATIPVGILGLALEHVFRVLFAKPLASAVFLMVNGVILIAGERYHRRAVARARLAPSLAPAAGATGAGPAADVVEFDQSRPETAMDEQAERNLAALSVKTVFVIGVAQASALLSGISREGVAMVGGLFRDLNREDAMRFAFLLATPVIFAAGLYKVPDLLGPLGHGIRPQVLLGSVVAGVTALGAVAFLTRYFRTRTLTPFAVYSLIFGALCTVRFGLF